MKTDINQKITAYVCHICGSKDHEFVFKGFDRLHHIPGNFFIYRCEGCGLFTTHPILEPGEMAHYYPDDYICYLPAIEDETNKLKYFDRLLALKKRVKIIKNKMKRVGRILDIGCATGILLSGMQKEGWECVGIEPDEKAANYARERFGFNVINGYLEDTNFPNDHFDVITILDVLEHVNNPAMFLGELRRILKPNGWVFATLPNSSAWEKQIFGPYWVGWEVPRHYSTYNPKNIHRFLTRNQFKNINVFSFTGRQGAFMMSIRFWLKDWNGPSWIKSLAEKILGSLPIRIIMLPIFMLSERLNRSTIMSFFAQKDP
jgi:2-polyprenyl-3-methyl-5-hydroxy-6-metoxy-1,4-benzoquinol methylase